MPICWTCNLKVWTTIYILSFLGNVHVSSCRSTSIFASTRCHLSNDGLSEFCSSFRSTASTRGCHCSSSMRSTISTSTRYATGTRRSWSTVSCRFATSTWAVRATLCRKSEARPFSRRTGTAPAVSRVAPTQSASCGSANRPPCNSALSSRWWVSSFWFCSRSINTKTATGARIPPTYTSPSSTISLYRSPCTASCCSISRRKTFWSRSIPCGNSSRWNRSFFCRSGRACSWPSWISMI